MQNPFLKRPKHQQFRYVPRYYKPEKEELQQRLERMRLEQEDSPEAMKSRISSGLKSSRGYQPGLRRKAFIRSNMIILIVLALLLVITYLFLENYLPVIFEAFH